MSKKKDKEHSLDLPKDYVPGKVYKAFSMDAISIPNGKAWVFITITFQDGQITEVVYSEPNIKSVIIEQFKIAAFKYWSSIG